MRSPDHHLRRRDVLALVAAGITVAGHAPTAARAAPARIRTTARIVIVGAGAAGLASAARLRAALEGARITLIDGRKEHWYQPGFTLVAAGIKPVDYPISRTTDHVPRGITFIEEHAAEIDPDARQVITASGRGIPYDYLVVASGMALDYDAIAGMDVGRIGSNGLGSIYHSPAAAMATWQAMSRFVDRGGVGVFLRPDTEMKCAGAPLKYTFIVEDYLTRRGTRSRSEVIYNANNQTLFSVPIVSEKVRMLFAQRGVQVQHGRRLRAIDLDRRIATFDTPAGSIELGYDFINVIPPMKAPEIVRNSPLPWQTGDWAAEGWMEVDRATLRHLRYANVFGVGDIAGVPKGKTAASVKWQVPVATAHLLADITGKPSNARYDGYTSCPLITRLGQAMLVEFDYHNNLTPSFPGVIAPLEELWVSWVMKTMALKPTYISMLRGKA
ncbi:pyridine nucleotide-disulfide oxidoreductase [Lampropedia cohaerens]|uniref:Pyridine nucleotide-disulfide oxidoreductase n=2 Tax=Lampropedia cohaerens TaxID=1610491 RepID=A0A0U1Q002_9BURK|nr:pyridine nucleotide-disulfide oxidoreductase [Lampropedia cohaerens]